MLKTEKKYDYVTIEDIHYSNRQQIDIILSNYFTVAFHSDESKTDKGFLLKWNCLNWGQWTSVGNGTCKKLRKLQPEYNGADAIKYTEYEDINETCSKFIYSTIHTNY